MFGLKKRTWIVGGVIAALLGTAAFAAKWRDHSPEERAAWATERISERLELDDAQKDALKKVTDSYVEIRGARPEFMTILSSQLKELAQDESLTVDEVNELRDQIKAEFDRRADAIIPEFVSFYNTLNDDQREKVMARLERMSEHMENRRGKHWGKHWGKHGRGDGPRHGWDD
ncbi:Spy/CpxP family protein refolding chaperone [Salaquimonas pukyongi]|uniref:Spy/CpxP family protein refolding chaperone n=1 Tax=Salaquimonas pukyongi TaxID=2712698 RepID=UPI00096BA081|nr:Spy/CpxP family protein refolding chaperone [Salaquimonas pukyongi]